MTTVIPEAVLFDADGVLQTTDVKWWYALSGLIGPADEERVGRFLGEIMAAERPALAGAEPFAGPLAEVLARWEVTTPAAEVLATWQHVDIDAGMMAAVEELTDRGIRCGLATNQHAERAAYMQRSLGYERTFALQFYSCDVGLAKPDPDYFRHAVRVLGTVPNRVLFVDDNADNVEGAQEAGLAAELFARDGGRPELDRILHRHGLS